MAKQLILKAILAIVMAVLFGNGSVVAFNHMPQKWFEDWNETDEETKKRVLPKALVEADKAGRQRITSSPWKYIFVALFGITGIYLAITTGLEYEVLTMIVLFVVLEMAIADQLYRIVPNELFALLLVASIGFIKYYDAWWEQLAGAGIGLLLGLAELGLGKLIYKKVAVGGADIKFFALIGLIVGRSGVLAVFILTTVFLAMQSIYKIIRKQVKKDEGLPMLPAGFLATLIYMLFLFNTLDTLHF